MWELSSTKTCYAYCFSDKEPNQNLFHDSVMAFIFFKSNIGGRSIGHGCSCRCDEPMKVHTHTYNECLYHVRLCVCSCIHVFVFVFAPLWASSIRPGLRLSSLATRAGIGALPYLVLRLCSVQPAGLAGPEQHQPWHSAGMTVQKQRWEKWQPARAWDPACMIA